MAKMTPEQEAVYAIGYKLGRGGLSPAGQLAYDRLVAERAQARSAADRGVGAGEPGRSPNCGGCGEELTPNARFCASCGQPANLGPPDTKCRGCGEELTPDARFCASCGHPANQQASDMSTAKEQSREFTVKYVTFYDGTGHRLGPSECTLTSTRLVISDARGGIHQIPLGNISGISTPSRMVAPRMLRVSLPGQGYDIDCQSKDQKMAIEVWLEQAIRGSLG